MFRAIIELIKYIGVSILSFIVDSGTLALLREFVFTEKSRLNLGICTSVGFIAGMILSYILSVVFVFNTGKKENRSGKSFRDFVIFLVIGCSGLILTELGMYAGVYLVGIHYIITKFIVATIVMLWNYVLRKYLIFNKKTEKTEDTASG